MSKSARQLPVSDGVSASRVFLPTGHWLTVLDFLCERFPHVDKLQWQERMAQNKVLNKDGWAVQPSTPYLANQTIFYYRQVASEPTMATEIPVLFEDDHLIVADKPHFVPVTPSGAYLQNSVLVQLKRHCNCDTLTPLHRLDRETAGLVVLCKQPAERGRYHAMFRLRQVKKWYEAVAPYQENLITPLVHRSRLQEDARFFLSREVAGEPNSETHITLLCRMQDMALYQLEPVTGRRHQLRLHMLSLGIPIAGDQFYPTVKRGPHESDDLALPLQLLAKRICFTDPVTGQMRNWSSQRQLQLAVQPTLE
ncbi:MAG: pseudouridine synthase [Limnohabitans sp.]